jgi:hypothetical protein
MRKRMELRNNQPIIKSIGRDENQRSSPREETFNFLLQKPVSSLIVNDMSVAQNYSLSSPIRFK